VHARRGVDCRRRLRCRCRHRVGLLLVPTRNRRRLLLLLLLPPLLHLCSLALLLRGPTVCLQAAQRAPAKGQ
jgi:hypothetical protein